MSSTVAQSFRRNILSFQLVTRKVLLSQSQKFTTRNSNPVLFNSSLSRAYTSSTFPPSSPQEGSSSSSYLNKVAKGTAKRLPAAILANLIVSVIVGFVGYLSLDLLIAEYLERQNKFLLNETVEKGTLPSQKISDDKFVPRPEILERLKKILQPNEDQSFYHVVCGEHGTGKTTITRIAAREVGRGVIYIDTPANLEDLNAFGSAFGKAINFTFDERISFATQLRKKIFGDTNHKPERPMWERAMDAFKSAAVVYKKKYGKPPVIVYDNVRRLMHKSPEILDILQDDAKDNADDREYIAVFVSSEGSVPRRMQSRSAWSRADDPIEIGDLTEEESLNYLIEKRKINEVEAKKVYQLVGGRIVDLNSVANKIKKGRTFNEIKEKILTKVEEKLRTAKLLETQKYHTAGKKVITVLYNSKKLKRIEFEKCFEDFDDANTVLESNVFAYHPESNTITFQSRAVEYYIQENESLFVNKK